jgi:hypothetical protein
VRQHRGGLACCLDDLFDLSVTRAAVGAGAADPPYRSDRVTALRHQLLDRLAADRVAKADDHETTRTAKEEGSMGRAKGPGGVAKRKHGEKLLPFITFQGSVFEYHFQVQF